MVRTILGIFDYVVYTLVVFAYELFYQVSNVTIISGSTASKFYGRVQVIFGIFIMFRIAIAVITGIINPDEFLDKNKGFGSIVKRIILALALLVLVIPTNVSVNENSSSYTKKISSHGFLFGTLYTDIPGSFSRFAVCSIKKRFIL